MTCEIREMRKKKEQNWIKQGINKFHTTRNKLILTHARRRLEQIDKHI